MKETFEKEELIDKRQNKGNATDNTKKDEEIVEAKRVSYFKLFKYANNFEIFLIIFGHFMSLGQGLLLSFMPVVIGDAANDLAFVPKTEVVAAVSKVAKTCCWFGLGVIGCAGLGKFIWCYLGGRMERRLKEDYFNNMLLQDTAWFDTESPEKITSTFNLNTSAYIKATGFYNHQMDFSIGMVLGGIVLAFVYGAIYTLLLMSFFPIILISVVLWMWSIGQSVAISKQSYTKAGGYADQAISGIKTVKSLNGEQHEIDLYREAIQEARDVYIKFSWISGACMGAVWFCMFINYGFGLWIGGKLIKDEKTNPNTGEIYNLGGVLKTFFAFLIAFFSIGNIGPPMTAITKGEEAAYQIYELIESKPTIQQQDPNGKNADGLKGEIELRNISFNYPTRPNIRVLKDLNVKIPAGKKVAFVGGTGCGKSTCIQLIERFYDPLEGSVLIDGVNVKQYNLESLRKYIGYVGQEPVLFAASIRENLLMAKPDATEKDLEEVLKQANAWNFIQLLENKLDQYVGTGGGQLSGGQKQRIAIARAMLLNPPILLLDESTSALDRKNEKEIQETLDNFSKNRTTVTIAHRLATIKSSDIIFVLQDGKVVESGEHHVQMNLETGVYKDQIKQQGNADVDDYEEDADDLPLETKELQEELKLELIPTLRKKSSTEGMRKYSKRKSSAMNKDAMKLGLTRNDSYKELVSTKWNQQIIEALELKDFDQKYNKFEGIVNEIIVSSSGKERTDGTDAMLRLMERNQKSNIEKEKLNKIINDRISALDPEERELFTKIKAIVISDEGTEIEEVEEKPVPWAKMWNDLEGNRGGIIIGLIMSLFCGASMPIQGYFFGNIMEALSKIQAKTGGEGEINFLLVLFTGLGIMTWLTYLFQAVTFVTSGQHLTTTLREKCYKKILCHDTAFFDHKDNSPGALCSALEEDCSTLNNLLTTVNGAFFSNVCGFGLGIALAFAASWRMSLCAQAVVPAYAVVGYIEMETQMGIAGNATNAEGNVLVQENVVNIKTIRAMNTLEVVKKKFSQSVKSTQTSVCKNLIQGMLFGLAQSMQFFVFGFIFYIGAVFRQNNDLGFSNMFQALWSQLFAAMGVGMAAQFAGDIGESKAASIRIYEFLDTETKIKEPEDPVILKNFKGKVEFQNVDFTYPTRNIPCFKNMSFTIEAGQRVAFAGPSGSGKSTVISLLLRFYDVDAGKILLDGVDIKSITTQNLRELFGLVGQEPFLFNESIKYNIKYNHYHGTDEEMRDSAVISNAINFIEQDEKIGNQQDEYNDVEGIKKDATGFDRNVGVKGGKLSGGQKQRVAIARAVLRKPNAFLFDEATSALDYHAEKIVQEALNKLSIGKTSISIAHRLNSIKDSDKIMVIFDKRLYEEGTFEELMNKKDGIFHKINSEAT